MFEIAGHNVTYDDVLMRSDDWFSEYTMTKEQEKEWIEWGENHIKKHYKFNDKVAKLAMDFVNGIYGLRVY
jgi:hypothetical protein